MIRNYTLIICLFFSFTLINCSSTDDSNNTPTRSFDDVSQDFSELNFITGNNDITLLGTGQYFWDFRVIMPDVDFTNNDRPLIITLHGYSGGDPLAHTYTDCYATPGFDALDAIIISPNGYTIQWFHPDNVEFVLALVELASTHLPVDTSKIVVNGYSDGGNGAWWFSETYPNIFSAGIPMASAYGSYHTNGSARTISIPIYAIHGENDELFSLENIQDWINDTVDSGSDVTLEVAPGLTHTQPCDYVTYVENASDWLMNYVW